jgi:hypothetical protein
MHCAKQLPLKQQCLLIRMSRLSWHISAPWLQAPAWTAELVVQQQACQLMHVCVVVMGGGLLLVSVCCRVGCPSSCCSLGCTTRLHAPSAAT